MQATEKKIYSSEFVLKSAEALNLQPPITTEEAIAIQGLLNQTYPDSRPECELRFSIVNAHDTIAVNDKFVTKRTVQLHDFFHAIIT